MPIIDDPRYTADAIVGQVRQQLMPAPATAEPEPDLLEVLSAASRQATLPGAAYARVTTPDPDLPDAPPDYDALDHVQGFEQYAPRFVDASTPAQVEGIKQRIREELADRDVLRRAGLGGPVAEIGMNLLDPTFLASIAVPELAIAKAGRIGRVVNAAVQGAGSAAVYELGMQSLQETRTLEESAFNVGGGALFGGVLGSLGRRMPTDELNVTLNGVRSEVGAAAATRATTLEQESFAAGGQAVSRSAGKIPLAKTDLQVVMESDSVAARTVLQDLADVVPILEKNVEGIATPTSIESLVLRHEGRVADFADQLNQMWTKYRARVPKAERMRREDFYAAISSAARRSDKDQVPEIAQGAAYLRSRVFDPLKEQAQQLGLLPDLQKEAQLAVERKAVDEYQRVESAQIYGDYSAGERSRILSRRDFRKTARDLIGESGDYSLPEAEDVANAIRDLRLQGILRQESGGTSTVLGRATQRRRTEQLLDEAYSKYLKRVEPVSPKKFRERAETLRAGAADSDPHVARMAKLLADQQEGKILSRIAPVKAAIADQHPVGAESYFRRMYDREAIRAGRREWDSILTKHFMRQGVEYVEARSVAEDVTRRILGADVGQANFNIRTRVPDAGPLHDRVLDIPDELIERYLVNDPVKVASAYVRELAPQIEVTKRFGDKDMTDAFDRVRQEYDILRENVRGRSLRDSASEPLSKLEAQEKATLEALVRVRDRIYGRAGRLSADASEGTRRAVAAARGWRNLTAAAKLGGTALTGGSADLARVVAQYGFMPTMSKLAKLAASPEFRTLARSQARRLGAAVEVALSRRVNVASDGAITEGWTQKLANGVYKWSGLNHVTDFTRTLSATLMEDTILRASADVAAGRPLPKWTRSRLASLGFDEDAFKRIHQQVEKHGGEVDGVHVSGSADWEDVDLAELYDAAILKESRITVMEPGAADRVWWMDSETGKVIGQLKSFSLATPLRLLVTPVQMIGQGQYLQAARLVGTMLIGGYVAYALRQLAAGRQPTTDVQGAAYEAYIESGLAGVLPDLISPAARRLGLWTESARYSNRNVMGAFGGPALGTLGDAYDFAMNRTADGMNARDLQLLRRLLPYQNVWWMRRAINALEGETAEALDLAGADTASFGERFMETRPLLPTAERGGTGTGRLVQ